MNRLETLYEVKLNAETASLSHVGLLVVEMSQVDYGQADVQKRAYPVDDWCHSENKSRRHYITRSKQNANSFKNDQYAPIAVHYHTA